MIKKFFHLIFFETFKIDYFYYNEREMTFSNGVVVKTYKTTKKYVRCVGEVNNYFYVEETNSTKHVKWKKCKEIKGE